MNELPASLAVVGRVVTVVESTASIPLLIAFAGGLISFLSPCVLPLVPSYLSIVSGVSYEDLTGVDGKDWRLRRKVLLSSVLFVFGFSSVFILLGASISILTGLLMRFRQPISFVGGILIIVFGLFMAGFFKISFLKQYFQPLETIAREKGVGYLGALLTGVSFGIGWTPCIGPTLGAILTLAAVESGKGVWLLSIYSAGLALPFLTAAIAFNGFLGISQRFKRLLPVVQKAGGIILILMGVLLMTGQLTVLNTYAISLTPQWMWKWL